MQQRASTPYDRLDQPPMLRWQADPAGWSMPYDGWGRVVAKPRRKGRTLNRACPLHLQ
jgi:hypothetical protein